MSKFVETNKRIDHSKVFGVSKPGVVIYGDEG